MKRTIIAVCIMMLAPGYLAAYDWAKKGYTVESETVDGERATLNLKDAGGKAFTVIGNRAMSDAVAERIIAAKKAFDEWQQIKVQRIAFEENNEVVDITVTPSELTYKGENILESMPAGMWFSYTDALLYNFRITRFNVLVRISGEYKDEAELLEKLLDAYKNPLAYSRKRDPEYLLTRVNDLHDALIKLQNAAMALGNKGVFGSALKPLEEKAVRRVVELRKGNSKISVKEIQQTLDKEKLSLSEKEINLILGVFFNQFEK